MRISAALFYLVFGLVTHLLAARWAVENVPAARARPRVAWAVAVAFALLPVTLRLATHMTHSLVLITLMSLSLVETCAVALASLPVAALAGAFRVAAVFRAPADAGAAPRREPPAEPSREDGPASRGVARDVVVEVRTIGRREAIQRGVGLASFAGASTLLGWGAVRGRHAFEIREVVVRVPDWPRALEGYTIVQVSDIHVGVFTGDRELDEGFELVKRAKGDLLVATGDLVDYDARLSGVLARRLLDAAPRDGAFAILGNHDHYAGAYQVKLRMREAGLPVLDNEARVLRAGDGGGFVLAGVDDLMGRRAGQGPDLGRALRDTPRELPRVLLAHQPNFFREVAGTIALQLSGHTHGGQVNPGFRPADALMEFVDGLYQREGSALWVNRGFGVVGPPSRVGAPPEVSKVVIVSG